MPIDKMEYTKEYINKIKEKFDLKEIERCIKKSENINVLAIGDIIIDHYIFVTPKGRAIKDPILSVEYVKDEIYAGGILAVVNHLSDFVKKIKLVTLIGDKENRIDFIKDSMGKNIELKTFIKKNSPTIVKKRFVNINRYNKLFKVEYMNDEPIDEELTKSIIDYLDKELPKYDFVIVGDFGHGFINETIRRKLEEKSKFLTLNVQSNSANMGYNYFNLYKKFDFISVDEQELRLPLLKRFDKIEGVIKEVSHVFGFNRFLVTQGKNGCIFVDNENIFEAPALTSDVKDTVGAGDAVFAISSLFSYIKADSKLIPFIANCAGAIKVSYLGNKESVTKERLFRFINKIYSS
jgi:rfaE bifunctional protein kinase chain/domain